jgi:hypothetical protein
MKHLWQKPFSEQNVVSVMDDILIQKINEILKTRKNCTVNIINDRLTLAVFSMLRKNLKNVSKINFIIRDPRTLPVQGEVTREFELSVNDTLFNAYDIMEKNKLRHFEQARTMFDFIDKHVSIKRTTTACRIKGNVLLIDDVFMIQGTHLLWSIPLMAENLVSVMSILMQLSVRTWTWTRSLMPEKPLTGSGTSRI